MFENICRLQLITKEERKRWKELRTHSTKSVHLCGIQILFMSCYFTINKVSSRSDLSLGVQHYFRGRTVLREVNKTRKSVFS